MKHVLYTESDFVPQDIIGGNKTAVAVVCDGLPVCKVCGAVDPSQLAIPCFTKIQKTTLYDIWRGVKTGHLPAAVVDLRDAGIITAGTLDGFNRLKLTGSGRDAVAVLFL